MWRSSNVEVGPSGPETGVDYAPRTFAGQIESINGRLRDKLLNVNEFDRVRDVR